MSANNRVLTVENGALLSLPTRIHGHFKQNRMLELLWNSVYDMSRANLAFSRAREVHLCHYESSYYSHNFNTALVLCLAASVELGRKLQGDDAASAKRNPSSIPVVFVERSQCHIGSKLASASVLCKTLSSRCGGLSDGGS